jgi:tetratricopeptide (TPR) repeat protein
MSRLRAILMLVSLLTAGVTLGSWLQPRATKWTGQAEDADALTVLLGDARRMFANHFFIQADVYFHNRYYPSIFDQAQQASTSEMKPHLTGEHHDEDEEKAHEQQMDFLGKPKDWIDRFGRHFFPSEHSHLDKPGEAREILPWLLLSADMDPQRIESYVVAAYWLRKNLGKVNEAEQFLREGLRANPQSYELLFELGRVQKEDRKNPAMACNLWELALRRWREQEAAGSKPDALLLDAMLANLAAAEEDQGHIEKSLAYLEEEVKVAPVPEIIQKRIDELKKKLGKL